MDIDLVWLGRDEPPADWSGAVYQVSKPNPEDIAAALGNVGCGSEACLFWHSSLGHPDANLITELLEGVGDIWHAGLKLGMAGSPGLLDFVQPSWMLICDPPPEMEATSWRLNLRACLVRTSILRSVGHPIGAFDSLEASSLEWGHRCWKAGAFIRHHPALLADVKTEPGYRLTLADEFRFVKHRFGMKWAFWAAGRAVLSGYAPWHKVREALRITSGVPDSDSLAQRIRRNPDDAAPRRASKKRASTRESSVSVLIPTIDRYPYLRTLLKQLGDQTIKPDEIIIVDQTPSDRLQSDLESEFTQLPVRQLVRKKAGQCSSRNHGLAESRGDYILFLDDDVEIPSDLIEGHLENLRAYDAQTSSGYISEGNEDTLPEGFQKFRVSDVFPTSNTMVRRDVLNQSGLFDLAFDHGSRADKDLGMRLYLTGALMLYDPELAVFHHRAGQGGLRAHKARVITRATSRAKLLHRHLPSTTEIYLLKRYFTSRQTREAIYLRIFGTFSVHGRTIKKLSKRVLSLLMLPHSVFEVMRRQGRADALLTQYPQIPSWGEIIPKDPSRKESTRSTNLSDHGVSINNTPA